MIKTERGRLEANGTLCELKADLSVIVHGIYNNLLLDEMSEEEAKELIVDSVNRALKTEDEIQKEISNEIKKDISDILEGIAKIMKGQGDE